MCIFFRANPRNYCRYFFTMFKCRVGRRFRVIPMVAQLFPFRVPRPRGGNKIVFHPLSSPSLRIVRAPYLILVVSFIACVFSFSKARLVPTCRFATLLIMRLSVSIVLGGPRGNIRIPMNTEKRAMMINPMPCHVILTSVVLFQLVLKERQFSVM